MIYVISLAPLGLAIAEPGATGHPHLVLATMCPIAATGVFLVHWTRRLWSSEGARVTDVEGNRVAWLGLLLGCAFGGHSVLEMLHQTAQWASPMTEHDDQLDMGLGCAAICALACVVLVVRSRRSLQLGAPWGAPEQWTIATGTVETVDDGRSVEVKTENYTTTVPLDHTLVASTRTATSTAGKAGAYSSPSLLPGDRVALGSLKYQELGRTCTRVLVATRSDRDPIRTAVWQARLDLAAAVQLGALAIVALVAVT